MKIYCVIDRKIWDRKLIHIVSALDVERIICETIPEKMIDIPKIQVEDRQRYCHDHNTSCKHKSSSES